MQRPCSTYLLMIRFNSSFSLSLNITLRIHTCTKIPAQIGRRPSHLQQRPVDYTPDSARSSKPDWFVVDRSTIFGFLQAEVLCTNTGKRETRQAASMKG